MLKSLTVIRYVCLLLIFLSVKTSVAQLKVYPVLKENGSTRHAAQARTEHDQPLTLPFWDDFSFSAPHPSDTLWEGDQHVYINNGLASNPPTLGVASFDGLDGEGKNYKPYPASGPTDSLTSRPIDMSALTVGSDVYISFFYQFAGNGENPEDTDSLRLEFKNSNNEWVAIWPDGEPLDQSGDFVQVIKKVDDASFFHDHFQFKFQSYGRQSGPFDIWNVDYVYLNKGRTATNTAYPDRAISAPITSLFSSFTAIPYKHFSPSEITPLTLHMYSLDTIGDPAQPIPYTINTELIAYPDTAFNYTFNANAGQPLPPQVLHPIQLGSFLEDVNFAYESDSMRLNVTIAVNSGDNANDFNHEVFKDIDFRVNDTTRVSAMLSSYYSYDDGSAEYAAGFDEVGNRVACEFNMLKDTVEHIVAVDIYFPYIRSEPAGKPIDLIVWTKKDDLPGVVLHKETSYIKRDTIINNFTRYVLQNSVEVNGSFFIGYRQKSQGYLGVGLDYNTNSGDMIYYNVGTGWQKNEDIEGSVMIRPVFGPPKDVTVGLPPAPEASPLQVYPNPSKGVFRIKGTFNQLKVFDIRGVEKTFTLKYEQDTAILGLENQAEGLYILQFIDEKEIHTVKVLKK